MRIHAEVNALYRNHTSAWVFRTSSKSLKYFQITFLCPGCYFTEGFFLEIAAAKFERYKQSIQSIQYKLIS